MEKVFVFCYRSPSLLNGQHSVLGLQYNGIISNVSAKIEERKPDVNRSKEDSKHMCAVCVH